MNNPRILVVEDDRIIARSLRMILERSGYEVTALASTGRAAIREAATWGAGLEIQDRGFGFGTGPNSLEIPSSWEHYRLGWQRLSGNHFLRRKGHFVT